MAGDVVESCSVVADRRFGDDGPDRRDHEQDDGRHLDGGKPELRLAEHFDAEHVQGEHNSQRDEGENPLWNRP